jgi:hypothetical protein
MTIAKDFESYGFPDCGGSAQNCRAVSFIRRGDARRPLGSFMQRHCKP